MGRYTENEHCTFFSYLVALAIMWRQNTCHVPSVRAIRSSRVSRSLQFIVFTWKANECCSCIMLKNEKNCSVRADSYVLQYRLDRAEVVSTIRTKSTFSYFFKCCSLAPLRDKGCLLSSSVVLHWAVYYLSFYLLQFIGQWKHRRVRVATSRTIRFERKRR